MNVEKASKNEKIDIYDSKILIIQEKCKDCVCFIVGKNKFWNYLRIIDWQCHLCLFV